MKGLTKKVLSLVLVLALIFSLGGCSQGKKVSNEGEADKDVSEVLAPNLSDPITIRFSWWGGDSRQKATLDAIDAFMVKYPNITVEAEYGAWDGWQENVATQLAGGTEPDLLQINWNWIYQFSPKGDKFYNLNNFSEIVSLKNYSKDLLDLMSVNGSLQGIPVGTTGRVFYWNEATYKKAGIATPTSFQEIIDAGETFKTVLGDEYYPLALGEYDRILMLMYYLHQTYGKEWVTDGKVNYSVEEVTKGLEWINMLEDKHVIPSLATIAGDGADSLDKNTKWMDGFYGGIYEWDSSAAKFKGALSEGQSFVMGQFPKDLGKYNSGFTKISMGYAISAKSEHPAEAALLLEYLTSDPEGVEIIGLERGIVANTASTETLVSKGILSGITFDANKLVMDFKGYDIDPNFEHSSLKDSTGYYYEVFQNLSYDKSDAATAAKYLIECVENVNSSISEK